MPLGRGRQSGYVDTVEKALIATIITGKISSLFCVMGRSVYSGRERKASPMSMAA